MLYSNDFFSQLEAKVAGYKSKYSKQPRKSARHLAFWSLRKVFSRTVNGGCQNINSTCTDDKLHIAFLLDGGIGDILINAGYIQEFLKIVHPNFVADIFSPTSPDIMNSLFYNKHYIRSCNWISKFTKITDYDLVIELVRIPFVVGSSHERLERLASSKLIKYLDMVENFQCKNPLFFKYGTPGDHLAMNYALLQNHTRRTQMDVGQYLDLANSKYHLEYDKRHESILEKYNLEPHGFFTMQRGAGKGVEATKLWAVHKYNQLVVLLKEKFPEYPIVQLGVENSSEISGVDIGLRGKTSFESLKAILANSYLHIDGEGGLIHICHFVGGKGLALYGPTSVQFYGYANNINISAPCCQPYGCEWLTNDWNTKCVRGFDIPPCMEAINPEQLIERIIQQGK